MLGRCQSTRTAKFFYQQLPGCLILCVWHKLPCEEHRLLLSQCQTPAANQGADMEKLWAHHHSWLAWIGTDLRSPAVWLDGPEVSGKSPPAPSFNSCSAVGCDFVSVCAHMLVCVYARHIHITCNSMCTCIRVDWPNLLYSTMYKHRLPHPA